VEHAAGCIGSRGGCLDLPKRCDQIRTLAHCLARNPEVIDSPGGMCAEKGVCGNRYVSESVPFETEPRDDAISQLSVLVSRAFLVRTHDDTVIRWRASRSTGSG